jgi:serine/threonine-protein kinase
VSGASSFAASGLSLAAKAGTFRLMSGIAVPVTGPVSDPAPPVACPPVPARTDVWALGIVLYKLMSGRAPFEGQSANALSAAISADAPPPLLDIPVQLNAIVLRCLEKSPARRMPAVTVLARELQPFATERGREVAKQILARTESDESLAPATPFLGVSPALCRERPVGSWAALPLLE